MEDRVDSYTGEMEVVVEYLAHNPGKAGEDILNVTGMPFFAGNGVNANTGMELRVFRLANRFLNH